MKKKELVTAVAEKSGLTRKDAQAAVDALVDTIEEALAAGDNVQIFGFGTFEVRERKARFGRNPKKPEEVIKIDAAKKPVFKPGKLLKDAINK